MIRNFISGADLPGGWQVIRVKAGAKALQKCFQTASYDSAFAFSEQVAGLGLPLLEVVTGGDGTYGRALVTARLSKPTALGGPGVELAKRVDGLWGRLQGDSE